MEKKTFEILKKVGWYEGRKIDIEEIVKFLESKGYYVHKKAKKFIEEFGMLNIEAQTQFSEEIIKNMIFLNMINIQQIFIIYLEEQSMQSIQNNMKMILKKN
ncbi:SUKH-3 domain-containing protein [Clostridium perfringens]|uniref:SUKH-3 domain-containing protein n=1 Tax=Clostridium perfringens TaxID=1502 RepID=UPI0024BBEE50|nr:SUKH-3 domain-containing protein [Clostridium perfringens]